MSLSGWKATEIRFAPKYVLLNGRCPIAVWIFCFLHICRCRRHSLLSRQHWPRVTFSTWMEIRASSLQSRRKDCSRAQRRKWMKNEIHFDMCDVNWILIEIDLWEKISIFNQIERLERKGQVTASTYLVCLFRRFERCTQNFLSLSTATQCAFEHSQPHSDEPLLATIPFFLCRRNCFRLSPHSTRIRCNCANVFHFFSVSTWKNEWKFAIFQSELSLDLPPTSLQRNGMSWAERMKSIARKIDVSLVCDTHIAQWRSNKSESHSISGIWLRWAQCGIPQHHRDVHRRCPFFSFRPNIVTIIACTMRPLVVHKSSFN